MDLKKLKTEADILLDEFNNIKCSECEYLKGCSSYKTVSGGATFCNLLTGTVMLIDLLEKDKYTNK